MRDKCQASLLFRSCFISTQSHLRCTVASDSFAATPALKNARPRFPAIRIATDGFRSFTFSHSLMLTLEGIVSISGGAHKQPFLFSFFFFYYLFSFPLPWITFVSNVGPLKVGYFIHLEYKAKVSPADHMPSLHARAHAYIRAYPSSTHARRPRSGSHMVYFLYTRVRVCTIRERIRVTATTSNLT